MKKILIIFFLFVFILIVQVFSVINWSGLPNLTEKKRGATSQTVNDDVYVVGGFNISNGFRPTVEYYNLITSTEWIVISNLPTPRAYLTSVMHDTAIIAIGGGNDPGSPAAALVTVELYDYTGGHWENFPDMNTPRSYHCSEIIGDTIYGN